MLITSLYTQGDEAAIARLSLQNGIILPVGVWEATPEDRDIMAALKADWRTEVYLISPSEDLEDSLYAMLLKADGFYPKTSRSFKPTEGLAVYKWLNDRIIAATVPFWPMLQKNLELLEKSPSEASPLAMAFLQGCIEAQRRIRKSDIVLGGATIEQTSQQHIPVSQWRAGPQYF